MRKWTRYLSSLALLALLCWVVLPDRPTQAQVGPSNQILCNKLASATLTGTGSTVTTSLMSGLTGQTIVICGWHVTESGTTSGTFQLISGTQGGPCGTPTVITPGFSVSSTAPATDHVDYASLSLPMSSQLCVVTTGAATSTLQIGIWAAQFP